MTKTRAEVCPVTFAPDHYWRRALTWLAIPPVSFALGAALVGIPLR